MNQSTDVWEHLAKTIPPRHRAMLLVGVFVISMAIGLIFVKPINNFDFNNISQGLRYMLKGEDPYWFYGYYQYYFPPWSIIFLWPLAFLTVQWMVALDVALWIVFVLGRGRPAALLLVIHPLFLLLIASGNSEIIGLVIGIWLIFSNVKGWPRGIAILLLTIKFQTVFLLILLESLRILLDRDWKAVAVIAGLAIPPMILFPRWIPNYFLNPTGAWTYSFSVIGTGGVLGALSFTIIVLIVMRKRLDEWRTLAIFLSLVWTPYVLPFSYVSIFIPLIRARWWRIVVFLAGSLALLPIFFQQFHTWERVGTILMLALAVLLCQRDPSQTELTVAAAYGSTYPWSGFLRRLLVSPDLPASA